MDDGVTRARLQPEAPERFVRLRRELGVTSFGINQMGLEPGQRMRIHLHERQEEVYLVLDGRLSLLVEGEELEIGPGETPTDFGPGSDLVGPLTRLLHVEELRPDICTLDCGTLNFGDGDFIYVSTPAQLRAGARRITELGVKAELEIFDTGHLWFAKQLLKEGLLKDPLFQLCLGIPWGAPADTTTMKAMVDNLPAGACWAGFGIGRMQMPMAAQAMLLGGNVRVGLEDNLWLDRGVHATNGSLVERVIQIIERLGGRALSPAEGRDRMQLGGAR